MTTPPARRSAGLSIITERYGRPFQAVVKQAVPSARFAGPDIAKGYSWVTAMAGKHPDIDFLTGHYYAEGPPADPKMTLEYLLHRGNDPASGRDRHRAGRDQSARQAFRMTEGNSCFHGGKPGVSDTVASALWCADYMLQVAQAGYIGVNLHGGGNGLYTPIAGSLEEGFIGAPRLLRHVARRALRRQHACQAPRFRRRPPRRTLPASLPLRPHAGRGWKLALFNKAPDPVTIQHLAVCLAPRRRHT